MIGALLKRFRTGDWLGVAAIASFIIFKLSHLTFRFGDGDAYWYMLQAFIGGHLPYRDFFLADPPVFLLFLTVLKPFLGTHWLAYQALPIFLEALNAVLIYLLLRPLTRLSWLSTPVYLFSFTILATSDFSTGVQLTVLFSLLAWYMWQRGKPALTGGAWALSALTKLYAIPAMLGFFAYTLWRKQPWPRVAGAVLATGAVLLAYFFIAAPQGFIHAIILHQLHRPAGNAPGAVWLFFWQHEWALILLTLIAIFYQSRRALVWSLVLSALFFVFFKDLYYLYFAYLIPSMVILGVLYIDRLWQVPSRRPLGIIVCVILTLTSIIGVQAYRHTVMQQGRFLNAPEIAEYLKTQTAHDVVYGSHEVAPLLALLSGKEIFDNHIDTNGQVFAAGTEDREAVSHAAAEHGVYLVARITDLPEYNLRDVGYESYFSPDVFKQACKRLKFFPSTSNESDNFIAIYDCKY